MKLGLLSLKVCKLGLNWKDKTMGEGVAYGSAGILIVFLSLKVKDSFNTRAGLSEYKVVNPYIKSTGPSMRLNPHCLVIPLSPPLACSDTASDHLQSALKSTAFYSCHVTSAISKESLTHIPSQPVLSRSTFHRHLPNDAIVLFSVFMQRKRKP